MEERKEEEVRKEDKGELHRRVQDLRSSQAAALAEVDLLERFISRRDPQDRGPRAGGDGSGSQPEGGGRGRRRRSRSHLSHHLQQLTLEQKLHVAQTEVKETQQDRQKLRQRCERVQDHYKVALKEAELRLSDIRKAQTEFKRRLLRPVEETRPDMVLQSIQDKSKDVFQDFDEQRTEKSLDELQVNCLKVQRALSAQKEKLLKETQESTELSGHIANRKQILARIEEEIRRAEEERLRAEPLNRHLRGLMADYQAPGVMEYIHVKNKHRRLQRSVGTLERRVRVAEMALQAHRRAVNPHRATFTPANSADVGAGSVRRRVPGMLPDISEPGR